VRKRLLLVLLDRETFDYVCAGCGSVVGKKEQPLRRSGPREPRKATNFGFADPNNRNGG
jgi:hypothetical protein